MTLHAIAQNTGTSFAATFNIFFLLNHIFYLLY